MTIVAGTIGDRRQKSRSGGDEICISASLDVGENKESDDVQAGGERAGELRKGDPTCKKSSNLGSIRISLSPTGAATPPRRGRPQKPLMSSRDEVTAAAVSCSDSRSQPTAAGRPMRRAESDLIFLPRKIGPIEAAFGRLGEAESPGDASEQLHPEVTERKFRQPTCGRAKAAGDRDSISRFGISSIYRHQT
jgi:hypothetical protein